MKPRPCAASIRLAVSPCTEIPCNWDAPEAPPRRTGIDHTQGSKLSSQSGMADRNRRLVAGRCRHSGRGCRRIQANPVFGDGQEFRSVGERRVLRGLVWGEPRERCRWVRSSTVWTTREALRASSGMAISLARKIATKESEATCSRPGSSASSIHSRICARDRRRGLERRVGIELVDIIADQGRFPDRRAVVDQSRHLGLGVEFQIGRVEPLALEQVDVAGRPVCESLLRQHRQRPFGANGNFEIGQLDHAIFLA